jgi:hypothetical protein
MPIPAQYRAPFCADEFYHLSFYSIDGLVLFRTAQHRMIFIRKCLFFLNPFATFFAYTILPKQFHLIIKIKEEKIITETLNWTPYGDRTRSMISFLRNPSSNYLNMMLERQINRMLVSYVNSFNYLEERSGGLFKKPFRRMNLKAPDDVKRAILFVHTCAEKEQVVSDYRSHAFHSLDEIARQSSTLVDTKSTMLLFENPETYRLSHLKYADNGIV